MKSAIALNNRILELYEVDENNREEDYRPKVIQIAEIDDYISIRQSAWSIQTDFNRKVFAAPEKLWQEVNDTFTDIEKFIIESIRVAPKDSTSKCYVIYCDDGYMYLGPYEKKEDNWITFQNKLHNIIVGKHQRKDNWQKNIDEGILDGSVIPVSEQYFDFILKSIRQRILLINKAIKVLYNPY